MDYLHIFCFFCTSVCINTASVAPRLTLPSPIYYVNDTIVISCDSGNSTDLVSIELSIRNTDLKLEIICEIEDGVWKSTRSDKFSDNCEILPTSGKVNLSIRTQLTEKMRSSNVTCKVRYFDDNAVMVRSRSDLKQNVFSDAYVNPTRLEFDEFEFDDKVPILNRKTRARCKSFGGFPPSEYSYEVRSMYGAIMYSITELKDRSAEFLINDQLKNGFTVTCKDKVHTRGTISLTKQNCSGTGSELCVPHYITSKVSSSNIVTLNPTYSNAVRCDVEGYPSDRINYSWTSDGTVLPSATAATYIIPSDILKEGKTEILTCTATHDTYGEAYITWAITWSLRATTTTERATPGASA